MSKVGSCNYNIVYTKDSVKPSEEYLILVYIWMVAVDGAGVVDY